MKQCFTDTVLTHYATCRIGVYAPLGIETLSQERQVQIEQHCRECASCDQRLKVLQVKARESAPGIMARIIKDRQPSVVNLIPTKQQLEQRRASSH